MDIVKIVNLLFVPADRIPSWRKRGDRAHLTLESKMTAEQLPQADRLAAVDPYFEGAPRLKLLEQQEPHGMKGIFPETAAGEISAVLANALRQKMIKIIDAIEVLLVSRKWKLAQFRDRESPS